MGARVFLASTTRVWPIDFQPPFTKLNPDVYLAIDAPPPAPSFNNYLAVKVGTGMSCTEKIR